MKHLETYPYVPRPSMQVECEEPQLRIVLLGHDHVSACSHDVRCMSTCARNLPADAADWDLSGLLVDGQAVSLDIVKAWLGAVYKQLGDGRYAQELEDTSRSMAGLYQLLRFADAVGSRQGVYQACLVHVGALEVQVPCSSGLATLIADGRVYSMRGDPPALIHECVTTYSHTVATFTTEEAFAAVKQAVSQQVEQLLWLAHKMQAASLITSLHTFIHSSVAHGSGYGLLSGCLGNVLTPRVLEAALGPRQASGAREWINSIVAQPAAIADHDRNHEAWLLKPVDSDDYPPEWIFQAQLTRRCFGLPAGTEVDVIMDLRSGMLTIGDLNLYMQLLLGPSMHSAEHEAGLMGY